jgi:SAM-dependent methyltransferase
MPPDPRTGAGPERTRQRQASSFGAVAAAYAEHRPDYAADAVGWVLAPVSRRRPVRVLDLGAGTGKLTAALARPGAVVTAVEPDPAMLAELRRTLPGVSSLPGRAEDIPLPDGSADAVVAGQAAHWFDMDRALPEIVRVLAPGGVLAGLWNTHDDGVEWVAGLDSVISGLASVSLSRWRARVGEAPLVKLGMAQQTMFAAAEIAEFRHGQRRTVDSLVATLATSSPLLIMDEAGRERLLAEVRSYLSSRPETAAGEFTVPLVTAAIRAVRV